MGSALYCAALMPVSLNFIKDFLIDDFYDANDATYYRLAIVAPKRLQ